jgi:glycosyltransferase involved in cell wall biosynthesis
LNPPTVAVDLRALVGEPTGIGVYTRSILLELARAGGRIVGLSHKEVSGAAELRAAGVRLVVRSAPLGVIWQQLLCPSAAVEAGADVLWSPINTLPWFPRLPAVLTVHDLTAVHMGSSHRAAVRWSVRPFLRRSLRVARAVIAVSRATASDLERLYPRAAAKVRVVHSGVDPEFVPGDAAAIASTRAEYGAADGYVLFAGTIEPRKNIGALLRAWEALVTESPDPGRTPPLLLAGPYGWHSQDVVTSIQRLRDLGHPVRHLGRLARPALVRLMQAARLFAFPSLYEGFGLPPLEALACGVPVVTTNVSSLPEVVGEAGVLVPAGDWMALSVAMRRVLDETPETAARRRRASLEQAGRFSWAEAARRHAEVFRAAAGG